MYSSSQLWLWRYLVQVSIHQPGQEDKQLMNAGDTSVFISLNQNQSTGWTVHWQWNRVGRPPARGAAVRAEMKAGGTLEGRSSSSKRASPSTPMHRLQTFKKMQPYLSYAHNLPKPSFYPLSAKSKQKNEPVSQTSTDTKPWVSVGKFPPARTR